MAQTQKARSKTSRAQKYRYPQPSSCGRLRHLVPRESLLRFQRPAASALRDAATPPGGWGFCRGNRLGVWSFPPNFLSGGSCIRKGRPDGSGSQAARPQGGTQAVRPGDRTRADIEVFFSRPDHRRMHPSRAGEVRDYRSSPQPGTGDGGQKKTAQGRVEITPAGHRHRSIRGAATASGSARRADRACRRQRRPNSLRLGEMGTAAVLPRGGAATRSSSVARPISTSLSPLAETELVRLVAGLILSIRPEVTHA